MNAPPALSTASRATTRSSERSRSDGDDRCPVPTPMALQPMCQRFCSPVEFRVRHLAVLVRHRDGGRGAAGRFRYDLVQAVGGVVVDSGVIPLPPVPGDSGLGKERQVRQALVGIGDDAAEQRHEVPGHPLDRRFVEEVGVVLQCADNFPSISPTSIIRSSGAPPCADVNGRHVERPAACRARLRPVPSLEAALNCSQANETWNSGAWLSVANRPEPLDEQREGVVLVPQCAEDRLLDAAEECCERRVAVQIGTENQRVGKVADEFLQPGSIRGTRTASR